MARHNLKIVSRDTNNEQVTTTINYVNGELSQEDYLEIAAATNDLTSNSYSYSQLISTYDLDAEELPTRTFSTPQVKPQDNTRKSVSPFNQQKKV